MLTAFGKIGSREECERWLSKKLGVTFFWPSERCGVHWASENVWGSIEPMGNAYQATIRAGRTAIRSATITTTEHVR